MTEREALVAIGRAFDRVKNFNLTEELIVEILIEQKIGRWVETIGDKVFKVFEKSSLGDCHA